MNAFYYSDLMLRQSLDFTNKRKRVRLRFFINRSLSSTCLIFVFMAIRFIHYFNGKPFFKVLKF